MAYDTSDLEQQAINAIVENNLMFIEEVVAYLPCSERTLYNHDLQDLQSIKDAINENRVKAKVGLRKKWYESDNATVQIALYKLIGTDDEGSKINSQKQTVEHSGAVKIDFTNE